MIALIIILIILAAIMLIPLGVHVACREGKFTVAASAWFYKLRLYPAKKKAEKSEEKPRQMPKQRISHRKTSISALRSMTG